MDNNLLNDLDDELFSQQPQLDLFGQPIAADPELLILPQTRDFIGEDILRIRAINSGTKLKKQAVAALNEQAVRMMEQAPSECFYVKGNVPSSKNSKIMVSVKRGNKEFTVPVMSEAAQKYIKETKGYWLANKVEFRNAIRELPLPIMLEFTFIRETLGRFDYINAAQILLDLMGNGEKGHGYLTDDESVYVVPIFNPTVFYHSELAGVLIRIIKP